MYTHPYFKDPKIAGKIQVFVFSCQSENSKRRRQACAETWMPKLPSDFFESRFVVGNPKLPVESRLDGNILTLRCSDTYNGLPQKTKAVMQYALKMDYKFIIKCDDDTYIHPHRITRIPIIAHDICARWGTGWYGVDFPFGTFYSMSQHFMKTIVPHYQTYDCGEDWMIGKAMIDCHVPLDKYGTDLINPWGFDLNGSTCVGHWIDPDRMRKLDRLAHANFFADQKAVRQQQQIRFDRLKKPGAVLNRQPYAKARI